MSTLYLAGKGMDSVVKFKKCYSSVLLGSTKSVAGNTNFYFILFYIS